MISDSPIAGYALLTKRDKAINAVPLQLMPITEHDLDRHNPAVNIHYVKGHISKFMKLFNQKNNAGECCLQCGPVRCRRA